jgi:hypothetical protein
MIVMLSALGEQPVLQPMITARVSPAMPPS